MDGLRSHEVGPVIPVSDVERSRAFYEDVLGLEGEEVPGGWALHAGGGTRVSLLLAPGDAGQADWPLASFETDDLEATVADLVRAMFATYLAQDRATADALLADDFRVPLGRTTWRCSTSTV